MHQSLLFIPSRFPFVLLPFALLGMGSTQHDLVMVCHFCQAHSDCGRAWDCLYALDTRSEYIIHAGEEVRKEEAPRKDVWPLATSQLLFWIATHLLGNEKAKFLTGPKLQGSLKNVKCAHCRTSLSDGCRAQWDGHHWMV